MRFMYVTAAINRVLKGGVVPGGFPERAANKLIASYVAGHYMTVSLLGDPDGKKPNIERLTKVDEVWTMCFRQPRNNQWRLFGRFIACNVFVGLRLWRRVSTREYSAEAERLTQDWAAHLTGVPYHHGKQIADYITGYAKDVDHVEW